MGSTKHFFHCPLGPWQNSKTRQTNMRIVYIQTFQHVNVYSSASIIFLGYDREVHVCLRACGSAFVCMYSYVRMYSSMCSALCDSRCDVSETYCCSWRDRLTLFIVQGRKLRQGAGKCWDLRQPLSSATASSYQGGTASSLKAWLETYMSTL